MRFTTLMSARLAAALSFLSATALGCVLTLGDGGKTSDSCPDENSYLSNGECFCDAFYDWCNPDDNDDLTCCESQTSNSNGTPGTSSNTNSTTDVVPTGGTDTGTPPTGGTDTGEPPTSGTTGPAPTDCVVDQDPPASCDEAMGENFLCLQAADVNCGPEGSKYYVCMNGVWVEDTTAADQFCMLDQGADFSYGCILKDNVVQFQCGSGSGAACEPGGGQCTSDKDIEYCLYGKLSTADCFYLCTEEGVDGITFDHGYCGEQDSELSCICCDEGEDGCPLGGSSSGGGSSTGGGSSSTG